MAGMEAGGTYENLRQAGVEDDAAIPASVAVGAINGLLEKVSIDRLFNLAGGIDPAKNIIKGVATAAAKQAVTEGSTEAAQEIPNIAAEILTGVEQGAVSLENAERIIESGFTGAVLGAVTGGAAGTSRAPQPQQPEAPPEPELEDLPLQQQHEPEQIVSEPGGQTETVERPPQTISRPPETGVDGEAETSGLAPSQKPGPAPEPERAFRLETGEILTESERNERGDSLPIVGQGRLIEGEYYEQGTEPDDMFGSKLSEEQIAAGVKDLAKYGMVKQETEPTPQEIPQEGVEAKEVRYLDPKQIAFDPDRFQYKRTYGQEGRGTSGSLRTAATFDPELAGTILVWRDPEDSQTYVVNGHNRLDLALRKDAPQVLSRFIEAETAEEARSVGALTNIAEGQGTNIDAAKFFRDSGLSREEVVAKGLPLTQKKVDDGLALSTLSLEIFGAVAQGAFPVERGVIIGQELPDQDLQRQLIKDLDRLGKRGKNITNDVVREMAQMVAGAPQVVEEQETLFGTEEQRTAFSFEKASLMAGIKNRLKADKSLFSLVSKSKNIDRLANEGNVIDIERNQQIAREAAVVQELFERLKNGAPISPLVNEGARRNSGRSVQGCHRRRNNPRHPRGHSSVCLHRKSAECWTRPRSIWTA